MAGEDWVEMGAGTGGNEGTVSGMPLENGRSRPGKAPGWAERRPRVWMAAGGIVAAGGMVLLIWPLLSPGASSAVGRTGPAEAPAIMKEKLVTGPEKEAIGKWMERVNAWKEAKSMSRAVQDPHPAEQVRRFAGELGAIETGELPPDLREAFEKLQRVYAIYTETITEGAPARLADYMEWEKERETHDPFCKKRKSLTDDVVKASVRLEKLAGRYGLEDVSPMVSPVTREPITPEFQHVVNAGVDN